MMSLALLEILVSNGLPFLADILDEFKTRKVERVKTVKAVSIVEVLCTVYSYSLPVYR